MDIAENNEFLLEYPTNDFQWCLLKNDTYMYTCVHCEWEKKNCRVFLKIAKMTNSVKSTLPILYHFMNMIFKSRAQFTVFFCVQRLLYS